MHFTPFSAFGEDFFFLAEEIIYKYIFKILGFLNIPASNSGFLKNNELDSTVLVVPYILSCFC